MNRHIKKWSWRPAGLVVALVSIAVVLASPGSAGAASQATSARPDAARVQAARSTVVSAASLLDQAQSTSRISGTTQDGRRVSGTFVPGVAKVNNAGAMMVRGTVHAVVHNRNGSLTKRSKSFVWAPVSTLNGTAPSAASGQRTAAAPKALAAGACPVLDLVLGPLDLDLLGLQVHLDKVVLNIVAQSGAGNLLGNLLCAVAGLLDGTPLSGLLAQLSALLTSIFTILRA